MGYATFKILHIIGAVLLVGNATVTAFWKVMADRTRDPKVIANAQQAVTWSDWFFTVGGIVLLMVGGYGGAGVGHLKLFGEPWLIWGQGLLVLSGAIWAVVLVPAQIRQARDARAFADGSAIPDAYWRDARRWLVWGIIATIPLVAAIVVMVVKPH
jgi:uncharacterized membrane protein